MQIIFEQIERKFFNVSVILKFIFYKTKLSKLLNSKNVIAESYEAIAKEIDVYFVLVRKSKKIKVQFSTSCFSCLIYYLIIARHLVLFLIFSLTFFFFLLHHSIVCCFAICSISVLIINSVSNRNSMQHVFVHFFFINRVYQSVHQ
jgi:hypothetical protein